MLQKPLIKLTEDRDFGGVINATFGFIGQEFKMLLKTILLYASLPIILTAIATSVYASNIFGKIGSDIQGSGQLFGATDVYNVWYFLSYLGQAICYFVVSGITFAYLKTYRERGHGNFEPSDVWQLFASRLGGMLGHQILGILVIFGFLLMLIIPGIYVAVPLTLVMMVKIEEDPTFGENWERCRYLVRDYWWATFGILFVMGLIHSIMSSILSAPLLIYTIVWGIAQGTGGNMEANTPFLVISTLISSVGSYLLYVIVSLAQGFQYYSLVERKDRTSLIEKIESISTETNI